MSLQSQLLKGDPKLEACLVQDSAHVTNGTVGDHVSKIQSALIAIEGSTIDPGELISTKYGPSTAAAVLAFKKKRNIINRSYQTQADDIVGKMTIAALDKEMFERENQEDDSGRVHCTDFPGSPVAGGRSNVLLGFSFSSTLVGQAVGPVLTPQQQALARTREAASWVAAAQRFIQLGKAQILSGLPADNFKDNEETKALNTHFKLNQHPKPLQHLLLLGGVYTLISGVIARANSIFVDDPTTRDFANAVLGGFFQLSHPFNGKIRFGPNYAGKGHFFQTSVIIHEGSHFVNRVIDHFASELPKPNGTPVNSSTGISHTKNYAQLNHFEAAGNAYTYAQFALHAFMGFDKRIAVSVGPPFVAE